MANRHELPGFDGGAAFGGALRFFEANDAWMARWGSSYGDLAPNLRIIASDAFGTMYGLDESGKVVIFWSETGEIEPLAVDEATFLSMIVEDPNRTINLDLYQSAVHKFGHIGQQQHFAFKVETAIGGQVALDNFMVMDADEHMRGLGSLAQQIHKYAMNAKKVKAEMSARGWTNRALAERWGCTEVYVSKIVNNESRRQWFNDAILGLPRFVRTKKKC